MTVIWVLMASHLVSERIALSSTILEYLTFQVAAFFVVVVVGQNTSIGQTKTRNTTTRMMTVTVENVCLLRELKVRFVYHFMSPATARTSILSNKEQKLCNHKFN